MGDINKISVPAGALRIEIDEPLGRLIGQPAGVIRGWFASPNEEIGEDFYFQVAGIRLPHCIEKREDVEGALPGLIIVGFKIHYDLSDYLPHIQNNRLNVRLISSAYDPYLLRFTIVDRALGICLADAGGV